MNPSVGCHSWLRKMIKKWCDGNLVIIAILAILTILALQIGVLKDRLNSYGGYFLVTGGDKKCGE